MDESRDRLFNGDWNRTVSFSWNPPVFAVERGEVIDVRDDQVDHDSGDGTGGVANKSIIAHRLPQGTHFGPSDPTARPLTCYEFWRSWTDWVY